MSSTASASHSWLVGHGSNRALSDLMDTHQKQRKSSFQLTFLELCSGQSNRTLDVHYSPHQTTKYFRDVRVISSRFWDCDTQFCTAEGTQSSPPGPKPPVPNPVSLSALGPPLERWTFQSQWCFLRRGWRYIINTENSLEFQQEQYAFSQIRLDFRASAT